jgi:outer membrane lipoprotein SlyB
MKYDMPVRAIAALVLMSVAPRPAAAQDPASADPVMQICLAPATVEAAPSGVDPLTAVRDAFSNFLTGPTLTVHPLSARLQSQVRQEAKLAGCGFLLLTTVKHERKTGGGGFLGKVAGGAVQQGAWAVSGSAGASMAGRVAAGAAAGAASSSINDYAMNSRQKDELELTYRLENEGGQVLVEDSGKRKAKSDGEDLLTPLAQKAADAIAAAVAK